MFLFPFFPSLSYYLLYLYRCEIVMFAYENLDVYRKAYGLNQQIYMRVFYRFQLTALSPDVRDQLLTN